MSVIPTILISNTAHGSAKGPYNGTDTTWYTDKYKGMGYYGHTDGLHTASFEITGLIGLINFQGSLAATPGEDDWFDIADTSIGNAVTASTTTSFVNFSGNFVWIRVAVTQFSAGTINKVIYN